MGCHIFIKMQLLHFQLSCLPNGYRCRKRWHNNNFHEKYVMETMYRIWMDQRCWMITVGFNKKGTFV